MATDGPDCAKQMDEQMAPTNDVIGSSGSSNPFAISPPLICIHSKTKWSQISSRCNEIGINFVKAKLLAKELGINEKVLNRRLVKTHDNMHVYYYTYAPPDECILWTSGPTKGAHFRWLPGPKTCPYRRFTVCTGAMTWYLLPVTPVIVACPGNATNASSTNTRPVTATRLLAA